MTHGSLFSGIGGFDIAAEWMGWENLFHCEWNDFGKTILKYYWPNAVSYDDITTTDFTFWRGKLDILTGGFPCQPYSTAGKRKGKADDRHLWPEMRRAIREIAPQYVVGENVYGLVNWNGGLVFEEVQADLEDEGYEVWPVVLPACGKDAPHRRDRVWFIANAVDRRDMRQPTEHAGEGEKKRLQERHEVQQFEKPIGVRSEMEQALADTASNGKTPDGRSDKIKERRETPILQAHEERSRPPVQSDRFCGLVGTDGPGFREGVERWEDFPVESPIFKRDDGLSERLDGITLLKWREESRKAYGNAIVPQVAYEIFKAVEQTHKIFTQ